VGGLATLGAVPCDEGGESGGLPVRVQSTEHYDAQPLATRTQSPEFS
jgi:hypothetical protein